MTKAVKPVVIFPCGLRSPLHKIWTCLRHRHLIVRLKNFFTGRRIVKEFGWAKYLRRSLDNRAGLIRSSRSPITFPERPTLRTLERPAEIPRPKANRDRRDSQPAPQLRDFAFVSNDVNFDFGVSFRARFGARVLAVNKPSSLRRTYNPRSEFPGCLGNC